MGIDDLRAKRRHLRPGATREPLNKIAPLRISGGQHVLSDPRDVSRGLFNHGDPGRGDAEVEVLSRVVTSRTITHRSRRVVAVAAVGVEVAERLNVLLRGR